MEERLGPGSYDPSYKQIDADTTAPSFHSVDASNDRLAQIHPPIEVNDPLLFISYSQIDKHVPAATYYRPS
jgi:hypothetical protein